MVVFRTGEHLKLYCIFKHIIEKANIIIHTGEEKNQIKAYFFRKFDWFENKNEPH